MVVGSNKMSNMRAKQVVETHKNISNTLEKLVSVQNDGMLSIPEKEVLTIKVNINDKK